MAEDIQECKKIFAYKAIRSCCKYPETVMTKQQSDYCEKKCENKFSRCCIFTCLNNVTGVYVNDQFNGKNELQMYDLFFGPGLGKSDRQEAKKLWMPIIEKSIETCEKLSMLKLIVFC